MYKHPPGHPAWLDIMDPDRVVAPAEESEPEEDPDYVADEIPGYGPLVNPVEGPAEEPDYVPADVPVADSEEDEEEEEFEEADHLPVDFFGYPESEDSDNEGILEDVPIDDAPPVECLTEEEVSVPSSPVLDPYYQPHLFGGKGPLIRKTARISIRTQPDMYSFVDRVMADQGRMSNIHRTLPDTTPFLTSGTKRKAPEGPAHFEIGESSQTQPPAPLPTACAHEAQIGVLSDRIQSAEDHIRSLHATSRSTIRRVDQHEEEERQDTEAIQTLIRRVGDSRVDVMNLQLRSDHTENVNQGIQNQLDAAEITMAELREQNRQLREQFVELVNYLAARFGR